MGLSQNQASAPNSVILAMYCNAHLRMEKLENFFLGKIEYLSQSKEQCTETQSKTEVVYFKDGANKGIKNLWCIEC